MLKNLQSSRVLSYDTIQECETREIVVGESSTSEITQFIDWLVTMTERDKVSFPCYGAALSVETLDILLSDIYRMAGLLPMSYSKMICSGILQDENLEENREDE